MAYGTPARGGVGGGGGGPKAAAGLEVGPFTPAMRRSWGTHPRGGGGEVCDDGEMHAVRHPHGTGNSGSGSHILNV